MTRKRIYNEFELHRIAVVTSQVITASGAPKSAIIPDNINVETFNDEGIYDISFGTEII